ncbi:MAG: hypothetical protein KatS3mg009_1278 [Acidimicrobiia bacterium]|nr:MAG: hypothetical protein KatS3mg009_1278 [Acidimicrobiia bacterium]
MARRPRARYVAVAVACLVAVVVMIRLMADNTVFLEPVSEAVAKRDEQGSRAFRMGGSVVPGSIRETGDDGRDIRFQLTEGGVVADVAFSGSPPDLFTDCAPVVVEGNWEGTTFVSDELLIKHGNEYEPPSDTAAQECPEEPEGVR